jgi:phage FluMu gp28-like protein
MNNRPPFVAQNFPGKCKIFPERNAMLLRYQAKFVVDDSQKKLALKARQIGLSWCTAYRVVRRMSSKGARVDTWVASRDEISAQLFLEDSKRWSNILNVAAQDLGQTIIDDQGHTAFVLRFSNGRRIHSMSSNADAQAGKRGDRILDEFALHPDPRKLYTIAHPGISWGDRSRYFPRTAAPRIISTN